MITRARWAPALAGVAAVALGVGAGELAAGLLAPRASPILVVGAWLIDLAPTWAKDAAIALFGTADKVALVVGIAIVLAGLASLAGWLEHRRATLGRLLVAAGAVVGVIAALSREGAGILDIAPTAVAAVVAIIALGPLLDRLPRPALPGDAAAGSVDPSRRRFLAWAGGAAVVGALGVAVGAALQAGSRAVSTVRQSLRIPAPATPGPVVPAGAELGLDGLTPVVTPNADFYRIDIALQVPVVDPEQWSLRIHGLVEEEVTLSWAQLLALPLEESVTTMLCVSNPVGGDLVGTARWVGYPVRELLARARPTAGADMVLSRAPDGFSASTPLEVLTDDRSAILAVGMNGDPLPLEHGFPVRMVVPGLYGYVSATKWVTELEVTRFADARAYWSDRGWSERGPVKISSRIDVPRGTAPAGPGVIAGVAWHPHTGIARVEVQVDDGPWREATLAAAIGVDTWVQWRLDWDAEPGSHVLRVRATSLDGETQTSEQTPVAPDGATGWHEVGVTVAG